MSWRSPSLFADRSERTSRQRIKTETEVDGQNKGTKLVGRDGIRSSGERLAMETVAKEENQGEHRKTWRCGRVKLRITCWTVLVFPMK